MPIIFGMRLSVNTFYGLSIGTIQSSIILFDPPTAQAEDLRLWVKANREYAETVISQKLYEQAYQIVDQQLSFQIRKISQILSLAETFKSFWLKAKLQITDSQHCLYFLACPSCAKSCGAAYGYEFTCFYCNSSFPGPKPLLRFQADLSDGPGILPVYVENREAKMLQGMTGEELVEADQ
ncbi:uncharacterized protein [Primulina huaijiensis]|uniref:uncharacterized protein n=1 Tax=Primulina huaijiensis TaxID=1492673 RepID=UPI003CC77BDB